MQSDDDDENAYNDDDLYLYVIGVCLNVCCKNQLFAMAYLTGHQIFIVGYVKYCWRICSGRVFQGGGVDEEGCGIYGGCHLALMHGVRYDKGWFAIYAS